MAQAKGPERLGESELIKRYFAPLCHPDMSFGLSDDAAFLDLPDDMRLVMTKDMLVADVHFFANDAPDLIARKALRVNLSDLASKGAEPLGYLLGLGLPLDWTEDWLACFCDGLGSDQQAFSFPLIGGDTVKSPERLTLSVTAFGQVPRDKVILRRNAAPGDQIYVTGTIGDSALGLLLRREADRYGALDAEDRHFLLDRFLLPQPRMKYRSLLRRFATAAMDISDGLLGDAAKMSAAAGVALHFNDAAIPLSRAAQNMLRLCGISRDVALTGGDDYELMFCASEQSHDAIMASAAELELDITRVGYVTEGEGVFLLDQTGKELALTNGGSYEHF